MIHIRVHVIFVGKDGTYSSVFVSRWLLRSLDSRFRGNDRGEAGVMAGKSKVKGQKKTTYNRDMHPPHPQAQDIP